MARTIPWTDEEMSALKAAVEKHGAIHRTAIIRDMMELFPHRRANTLSAKLRHYTFRNVTIPDGEFTQHISVQECAKLYGFCRDALNRWCLQGKVPARLENRMWHIDICVADALNDSMHQGPVRRNPNWTKFKAAIEEMCHVSP